MAGITDDLNNAFSYVVGQCTRFVAGALSWVPAGLGDANQWFQRAQEKGLPTGQAPAVGSVAVWGAGPGTSAFGHVAEVVALIPGGFRVAEENFTGGPGVTDVRDVTGSALQGLEGFIYPPGGAVAAGAAAGGVLGSQLGIGQAVAGLPASIGHGLANALGAGTHDVGAWIHNQLVPLLVALAVALVLFL